MSSDESAIFHRAELLVGSAVMQCLHALRVVVFGVGGVGSWCAESLVRSGVGHLTIVDSDRVSISNVNRQLMATTLTVGMVKVEALRERLLTINPHADVRAVQEIYSEETSAEFDLASYDFIVDAIDSLQQKAHLINAATRSGAVLVSSMGTALKMDPTRIRVAEFWSVKGCPLARALRQRFKKQGVFPARKFRCVYSDEVLPNLGAAEVGAADPDAQPTSVAAPGRADLADHDWTASKAQVNGTMAHTTAIAGFMLAGLVISDVYNGKR